MLRAAPAFPERLSLYKDSLKQPDKRPSLYAYPATDWLSVLGQRERHVNAARSGFRVLASARRNYHILLSVHHVRYRRGVSRKWQRRFPQKFSRRLVISAKLFV